MKALLKVAVVGLAFTASGAFAQGVFSRMPGAGHTYIESGFWRADGNLVAAPTATAAPYMRGDDIRNANSSLWGVGG